MAILVGAYGKKSFSGHLYRMK